MANGVISDLAAKALESLAKVVAEEAASWWGARDDLEKLKDTMSFIQARLRDAERRQEGENSELIKLWLRKLKLVLYRADDLFDDVLTLDRQNRRMEQSMLGKVSILFSRTGPLYYNIKLAHEIKSIMNELDAIKSNMDGFNLTILPPEELPLPMKRVLKNRETDSIVSTENVIGRNHDEKKITEMLFDPKYDGKRVTVIPIVGFGGIGKTTLAQLVYNDENVKKQFDPKIWVCVPEVDNQGAILGRIYQSLFPDEKDSGTLLSDQIKSRIHQSISNQKYLFVLDDIWDDKRHNWLDLLELLQCGQSGSRVIVTTRSLKVANAVGTTEAYKLGLLTEEDSWNLFKRLAFKSGQEESNSKLTQIGKKIVDRCGSVPLAIRVVGCLLYTKGSCEKEWQLFRDTQLTKAIVTEDDIMSVLKLSYDHLRPALKQCFAYCSLFPKDYRYSKADLAHLWMAQGYVDSSSTDNGEQYFMELLERSLFQDPELDDAGNVEFCKMHDLVHDLAQKIAGEEIKLFVDPSKKITTDGLIHVSVDMKWTRYIEWKASGRKMRSLLMLNESGYYAKVSSLEKLQSLRALVLEDMRFSMLPNSIGKWRDLRSLKSIGKLRHLRYLKLALFHIDSLPDEITRLENLQTLNLRGCKDLIELPEDFGKLANLQTLNLGNCKNLKELPGDFGKLANLNTLNLSHCENLIKLSGDFGKLANLKTLNLSHCKNLIKLPGDFGKLTNLQTLKLDCCYKLQELPGDFSKLANLQTLNLYGCINVEEMPGDFGKLTSLQELDMFVVGKSSGIDSLPALNLIGSLDIQFKQWGSNAVLEAQRSKLKDNQQLTKLIFRFISMGEAEVDKMLMCLQLPPNLEYFIMDRYQGVEMPRRWLDGLSKLVSIDIEMCRNCRVLPHLSRLPHLKTLRLYILDALEYVQEEEDIWIGGSGSGSGSGEHNDYFPSLEELILIRLKELKGWTRASKDEDGEPRRLLFPRLLIMIVDDCPKLIQLPEEMGKLRDLRIDDCPKLASLPQSLIGLTSLQKLYVRKCPDLEKRYKKPNGQDWHLLQHIPDVQLGRESIYPIARREDFLEESSAGKLY